MIDDYDNSDVDDDEEDGMPVGSQTLLPYYYCKCPGCRLDDVVFITRPNDHHPVSQYAAGWLAGCTRGLSDTATVDQRWMMTLRGPELQRCWIDSAFVSIARHVKVTHVCHVC